MKPVVVVLISVVIAAATAVVILAREPDAQTEAALLKEGAERPLTGRDEVDVEGVARPPVSKSPGGDKSPSDVPEQVEDYGVLIDKLLPLAEDGNAKAQYDVYKTMAYCQERVKFFFTRAGRRLSLEEGLAWALKRNVSYETAQAVHKKCRKFIDTDPKDEQSAAVDWLNASAKQGYAPAQSALAAKIVEEQVRRGFENASGVAASPSTDPLDHTKSATELLSEAVKSRDPEVLFTIGEVMPLLHPTAADSGSERLAWMALACERGFDCSAQAEWVVNSCLTAECRSINSQTEVVRILAGDRWHEVQARARELGASLDASQGDQLGLDPG